MSEPLRILLLIDLVSMAFLGGFYLRTRKLLWWEWVLCSLVMVVPLLGPFLIISGQPGVSRQKSQTCLARRADRLRAHRAPQ